VTVNIFLRELRGVWEKADPLPGDMVIEGMGQYEWVQQAGFITPYL